MPVTAFRYRLFHLCLLVVFASTVVPDDAAAHTMRPAVATLELDQTGALSVQIKVNAEALLVGLGPEHSDTDDSPNAAAYNELRTLSSAQLGKAFDSFAADFLEGLRIESDVGNVRLEFNEIHVPEPGDLDLSRDSVIELSGHLLPGALHIVWRWPERYGSIVVRLGTPGTEEPITTWLQAGQASAPLQVAGIVETRSLSIVITDYIALGFKHILPFGLDHILFVLGLFLLSPKLRSLLWQISAFTLAHTITLGLSTYGLISFPSNVVEPLIALSIAYVGIENCLSSELKPRRVVLVFAFGLLHGMGFAGVLGDIGMPAGEFLTALISFNIGVEFGQLAIICLALLVMGLFRQYSWYRRVIVIPGSLMIAVTGLYWTWERGLG